MPVGPSNPRRLIDNDSNVDRALMSLESEYPGATQVPIRNMSLLERTINKLRSDPAEMSVGTFGKSINVDPNVLQNIPQNELEDKLAHELTHVKQRQREGLPKFLFEQKIRPLISGYSSRPFEEEALAAEVDYSLRPTRGMLQKDIKLPSTWTSVNAKK